MTARASALALAGLIITSIALTGRGVPAARPPESVSAAAPEPSTLAADTFAARNAARKGSTRDWNVLDPELAAAAALVYSLDDHATLFGARTYARWPMASLAKLLTAVVVAEDVGYDARVAMTESAIAAEGNGASFNPGEEFSARDLARIMVIASSNDAAAAFEEHAGGRDAFTPRLRAAADKAGMKQTDVADAAGISPANRSSASDIRALLEYLAAKHPEILEWTRRTSFLFEPLNDATSRTAENVNPFASEARFLGGKTGTLPEARENFGGIFTVDGRRIIVIVLGSPDRVREVNELLDWTARAYQW